MKKLPKIYQAEFTKKIKNNKKSCYLIETKTNQNTPNNFSIDKIITEVFSGIGHPYNIPLIITTITEKYDTCLIAKSKSNLITLENQVIPISEVINIEYKKNSSED